MSRRIQGQHNTVVHIVQVADGEHLLEAIIRRASTGNSRYVKANKKSIKAMDNRVKCLVTMSYLIAIALHQRTSRI